MSARQRLLESADPFVAPLEPAKAARFNAATMLIPSPIQIRDAISRIEKGETMTAKELQRELAAACGADVTCPRATTLGWLLVAEAAEEDRAEGKESVVPWWRVTRERKPERRLPGGAERHRALLAIEGVLI